MRRGSVSSEASPFASRHGAGPAQPAIAHRRDTFARLPWRVSCERAYFIHLEEGGSDQLGNWLRAERELMTA